MATRGYLLPSDTVYYYYFVVIIITQDSGHWTV